MDQNNSAQKAKEEGNAAFQSGDFSKAIEHYSIAIATEPTNQVHYSNRSAAYSGNKQFQEALQDAIKAIELKPDWIKGYTRKGAALLGLNRLTDAATAYREALEIEDNEQVRQSLDSINIRLDEIVQNYRKEAPSPKNSPPNVADGAWVTMITPFTKDNKIDWIGVDQLVEWFIAKGLAGIFAVCLSSEMYNLTQEERILLARRVVVTAAGRIPVVASGTFGGSIEEQAKSILEIYDTGVEAVVVITSLLCKEGDNETEWKKNATKLLELTGNIPLGLYECPKPYLRLLTPETLQWAAGTGRFYFHKDVSCAVTKIKAKLEALQSLSKEGNPVPFKFYNANMATLVASVQMGGKGFAGIAANCYPSIIGEIGGLVEPDLSAWMLKNREKYPDMAQTLQSFLSLSEMTVAHKYPQSAKTYLMLCEKGFKNFHPRCRNCSFDFNEEELIRLYHMKECVRLVTKQIKEADSNPFPTRSKSVLL